MQRPLLVCPPHKDYKNSAIVAALGALQGLYMVSKHTWSWMIRLEVDSFKGDLHKLKFSFSHVKYYLCNVLCGVEFERRGH